MPSDLAAKRGEPSYVWRSGQERRLKMVAAHVPLQDKYILDHGCGIGTYALQFRKRYSPHVYGFDTEAVRVAEAREDFPGFIVSVAEKLPYADNSFDLVFSNEVIEHVDDDRLTAQEMVRVTRSGGRIVIFCPNRWYPVETHGHYWRGQYHFGNTPLINYLPDALRNRLAPHVRAYTATGLRKVFADQPVRVVHHSRVFGGYDNLERKLPAPFGKWIRTVLYSLENTPFRFFGLSHFLILEKI
ncbi:MAG: class I SAM-dependent methyltransferase [Anaerolineae bacterium]|nr:class I SAM-dependent methyltransferase [Anaerolineae bacterium]